MCISKISEFSCGHVETIHLNQHCSCPLLIGAREAEDVLCPRNCGSPVSPMAFRSLLGMAQDRSQVFGQCQVKLQVIRNSRKDEEGGREGGRARSTTWDGFELKVPNKRLKKDKKAFKKKERNQTDHTSL